MPYKRIVYGKQRKINPVHSVISTATEFLRRKGNSVISTVTARVKRCKFYSEI
jgi:hypothetical protein